MDPPLEGPPPTKKITLLALQTNAYLCLKMSYLIIFGQKVIYRKNHYIPPSLSPYTGGYTKRGFFGPPKPPWGHFRGKISFLKMQSKVNFGGIGGQIFKIFLQFSKNNL